MPLTTTQQAALEKKALATDSKSDGMRFLFEAGYNVAEVRDVFGCAYGFAYGVRARMNTTGVATVRTETVKATPKAKVSTAPVAEKRGRGRPTNASKAAAAPVKASAKAAPASPKSPARPASPKAPATKATTRR
jgi:hypothetical protein